MNTLTTIAFCLLGSALLQGIGFYLYSKFYKKRNLDGGFTQLSADAESDQNFNTGTRQPTGHKKNSTFDPFTFKIEIKNEGSGKSVPPVIPLHTKSAKRSAK